MPKLASLLESKLSQAAVEILRTTGELAASGEFGAGEAYLVGGSVRDLILGREPKDPDIVVTGNGPRFARALAEKVKGTVGAVSQFGTAVIESPQGRIDVATARSETYSSPAALPDITPSNMDDDLKRRDFTVNAMALALRPESWGELLDPYKGFADCARGRLRILHDLSFQDDPTRILRAVRYEVRLGFSFAIDTAEALERDLSYLDRLTSARLFAELRKLLQEPDRANILRRAEALGILGAISPALRVTETGLKAMEQIGSGDGEIDEFLYAACLSSSLTDEEADAVIARLDPDREWQAVIRGAAEFRNIASILETPDLLPSEVFDLLERIPAQVIEFQKIAGPNTYQREHLEAYLRRHRNIRADVTGDDLAEQGVPRGPIMGKLLKELRTARLDDRVTSRTEELELVRKRLPMLLSRERESNDQPAGAAAP